MVAVSVRKLVAAVPQLLGLLVWVPLSFMAHTALLLLHLAEPPKLKLVDRRGSVCVVTGCNTGIGVRTAVGLLKCGAHVVFACRSERRRARRPCRLERHDGDASRARGVFA